MVLSADMLDRFKATYWCSTSTNCEKTPTETRTSAWRRCLSGKTEVGLLEHHGEDYRGIMRSMNDTTSTRNLIFATREVCLLPTLPELEFALLFPCTTPHHHGGSLAE